MRTPAPIGCDVSDLDALVETVSRIRAEMGAPAVVVHNALRSTRGGILELDPDDLEKNFRVNTTALLYLARETIPAMLEAGKGAILVTGNTSATRGGKNFGFFASTKAAQRILAESIAREFGPQGIHVAYFIIDAAIDTPRTREVLAPGRPDDFFARPPAIAEELYRVAHQDPLRLVLPRRTAPLRRDLVGQRSGPASPCQAERERSLPLPLPQAGYRIHTSVSVGFVLHAPVRRPGPRAGVQPWFSRQPQAVRPALHRLRQHREPWMDPRLRGGDERGAERGVAGPAGAPDTRRNEMCAYGSPQAGGESGESAPGRMGRKKARPSPSRDEQPDRWVTL